MNKKWVNISDVLFFQEGPGVRNTQYTTKGVKLLNVANLVDGNVDLSTSDRYISEEEAYGKYKHFLCDEGDLIVASSGIKVDYLDKKMGFVKKEMLPLCMNTSTIRFKSLDEQKLNIRYFMYYVKTQHYKNQVAFHITGSAQLNYGPSHLKKMVMPLIELKEQQKIVTVLDKVSAIIKASQEELQKLDELIKARFVEMFGDPVVNDRNWQTLPLDEACKTIVDCPHSTPSYTSENTGYMCIRTSIVKKNKILWDEIEYIPEEEFIKRIQRKKPEIGDVVYTREGAILGIAAIIDRECNVALGQRSMLLSPNKNRCTSEFLCAAMNCDSFLDNALKGVAGSASPHINVGDIKAFNMIMPPIELQKQFATFVHQIDKLKVEEQRKLEKIQILFDNLMQQYFG